jgi:hypothetical protein
MTRTSGKFVDETLMAGNGFKVRCLDQSRLRNGSTLRTSGFPSG